MPDDPAGRDAPWQVIGASVRGAAHVRVGLPNQDAIGWSPAPGLGLPLALAVADGHGSARCCRSHAGARFAAEAALEALEELLAASPDPAGPPSWPAIQDTANRLVRYWRNAAVADLVTLPLSATELAAVERKEGVAGREAVENSPLLAYGTTVLAALVAETFVLYLQLGDGDILAVDESGEVTRPLPPDDRLLGNHTTSLCAPHAGREFRAALHVFRSPVSGPERARTPLSPVAGEAAAAWAPRASGLPGWDRRARHAVVRPPALVLLATDGYANSFRDDAGFRRVGSDILEIIRQYGLDAVSDSMAAWLSETSQLGCGDDVTVGLVCRLGTVLGAVEEASPGSSAGSYAEVAG